MLAINKSDAYANALDGYLLRLEGRARAGDGPKAEAEALDWVRRSLALSPASPITLRHEIALLEEAWGATTKLGKPTGARRVAGLRPDNR